MSSLIPVGFRFAPTEEELITDYLRRKVEGEPLPWSGVIERDIYGKAPWDVLMKDDPWNSFKITKDKWEHVIYVFTKLKKTDSSKKRISRRAGNFGTWNAQTGIDRILNEQKQHIGFKKMLVFEADFKKEENGLIMPRGHWIMHEYSLGGLSLDGLQLQDHRHDDYVLCKIKRDDSKCLKRALKHDRGHGAIVDIGYTDQYSCAAGCLNKTSHVVSKEENPTHKKMRYSEASTPENFDQEYHCLYDQSVTMAHQLLPTQQRQCSSPNNTSFEGSFEGSATATATSNQPLPALFDGITMNSSSSTEDQIQSFLQNLDFETELFANNIDPELEARLNAISEVIMTDDKPSLSVGNMDQIQANFLLF